MALPNSFDFNDSAGTVLLLEPDAVNDRSVALQTSGEVVVAPVGGTRYISKDGSLPGGVWTFEYFAVDRATLQFLKDFVDTQAGMAGARQSDGTSKGFWFPTWQWDLEVVNDNGSNFVDLVRRGYADFVFALGNQYRRILFAWGGAYVSFKVTAAAVVSGLDHLTTAIRNSAGTISPAHPWTRATHVRPLWLRYGRLDSDDFTYTHVDGGNAFHVSLTIREIPDEAPAGT